MSAYFIAQIHVHDPQEYQAYLAGFMPIFERHGGQLLVTSSKEPQVVEGQWDLPRVVLMRFPSLAQAQAWLEDDDYQSLAKHRHRAATTNLVLVEGLA